MGKTSHERQVVLEKNGRAMMALHKYGISPEEFNFDAARVELLNFIETQADSSHTWGYFPELDPNPAEYPQAVALAGKLRANLIGKQPHLQQLDYTLAFIRATSQQPVSDFGGLHIDVHIGIAHSRDPGLDPKTEIVRLLLNPYFHERTLAYISQSVDELRAEGISVPSEHYQVLQIPPDIPVEQIAVPPMEDDALYGLQFYSSLLPHAGITDSHGQFLIAYGAYTNPENKRAVVFKL